MVAASPSVHSPGLLVGHLVLRGALVVGGDGLAGEESGLVSRRAGVVVVSTGGSELPLGTKAPVATGLKTSPDGAPAPVAKVARVLPLLASGAPGAPIVTVDAIAGTIVTEHRHIEIAVGAEGVALRRVEPDVPFVCSDTKLQVLLVAPL